MSSFFRVGINTIMGLGGVLDVASEMGLERHKQDFGLTLGRWGMPPGPYLVLPILGPSTVRDTLALPVDMRGNPVRHVDPIPARNSLYALRAVDTRANLLRAGEVLTARRWTNTALRATCSCRCAASGPPMPPGADLRRAAMTVACPRNRKRVSLGAGAMK